VPKYNPAPELDILHTVSLVKFLHPSTMADLECKLKAIF